MTRRLAKEEGFFCGYSAGSCIQGLLQLKERLRKDDLVVCILHDHGSRYVGKVYNDQWMLERGFLEAKTVKDIIGGKENQPMVSILPTQTIAEAFELMKQFDIENIPVMEDGQPTGSVSENGLFSKIFGSPEIINHEVQSVVEPGYPLVDLDTPVERLGKLINKDNGAVLCRDKAGVLHIITKYDIIKFLTK